MKLLTPDQLGAELPNEKLKHNGRMKIQARAVSLLRPCFKSFRIFRVPLRMFLNLPTLPIKSGITPPRKPGGSPLARILLQTLQAAIAQGCSDQEVATRIVNKITRHGPGSDEVNNLDTEVVPPATRSVSLQNSQEAGERIYAKVVKTHPALAGKITGMLLELPTKDIQQLLASEPCFKLEVDECLKVLNASQKTLAQRVAQTSAGSKGSSLAKGSGKSPVKPRFASHLQPSEWTLPPTITSIPKVQKAVSEGLPLPGNMVVTRDPNVKTELQSIRNSFNINDALTIATITDDSKGPVISVWWNNGHQRLKRPQRFHVQISTIGTGTSPIPRPPVVVQVPKKEGLKPRTVRLLAPQFYRKFLRGVSAQDTPKNHHYCLGAGLRLSGCPFNWR